MMMIMMMIMMPAPGPYKGTKLDESSGILICSCRVYDTLKASGGRSAVLGRLGGIVAIRVNQAGFRGKRRGR
jgi:hypothetical protein